MYKKMCINMLVLVCCLFSSASYSIVVVDVLKIVGKTPLQVADILGTPSGCFITKYGRKCSYILADTEVVFINDKADWITVEGIDNIPFNNDVLSSLIMSITFFFENPANENCSTLVVLNSSSKL